MDECMWCGNKDIKATLKNCYWILPDGKDAVHILDIPAIFCESCGSYLTDETNHQIDLDLYAKDLPKEKEFLYEQLQKASYKNIFELKKE